MRMPMQKIKFRDFMSFVCTSIWNGNPASAKLNKGKNCFIFILLFYFIILLASPIIGRVTATA